MDPLLINFLLVILVSYGCFIIYDVIKDMIKIYKNKKEKEMKENKTSELVNLLERAYEETHYDPEVVEQIELQVVRECGDMLMHVRKPSDNVTMAALLNDGTAIKHLLFPDVKFQMAAVCQTKDAMKYIKDPDKSVTRFYLAMKRFT